MSSTIYLEMGLLTLLRFILFFACRKYLLRSLYSDLQSLSSEPTEDGSFSPPYRRVATDGGDEIELGSLPLPSMYTPKSSGLFPSDATFLHSTISRGLFSWIFAESCIMFFLLMLQGIDVFLPRTRLLNWRFSLYFLMATILVVIPLSTSLLIALGSSDQRSLRRLLGFRALFSFITVAVYLFLLSFIPLPTAIVSSDTATAALSRLIVLGTIILGLLSGFGAISSSWKFIPFLARHQSVPSERDVEAARYALFSIRNDLRDRREEVKRRVNTAQGDSWFSRVGASFRGGDSLTQELAGLEALEYQMSRNFELLSERRQAAEFSHTLKGRLFSIGGTLFAAYCIIRVISSIFNIVFLPTQRSSSTTTYPDLIARLLVYLLSLLSPDIKVEDVASFARQLSLVLVGLIILSSIRLVLRGVTRFLRVTSRSLGASLMLLVLAQLMGIYLLSTVVQLRSSFPPPPTKPDQDPAAINLFSTIPEYEVFGSLFDWSFLISAGASVFIRWGAERVNGPGDM